MTFGSGFQPTINSRLYRDENENLTERNLGRLSEMCVLVWKAQFTSPLFCCNAMRRVQVTVRLRRAVRHPAGVSLPRGRYVIRCWRNPHSFSFLINLLVGAGAGWPLFISRTSRLIGRNERRDVQRSWPPCRQRLRIREQKNSEV